MATEDRGQAAAGAGMTKNHIPTAEMPVVASPGFVLCEGGHVLPADGLDGADKSSGLCPSGGAR